MWLWAQTAASVAELALRPVVCGVDQSQAGGDAARVARVLARLVAAPLVLVHVVDRPDEVVDGARLLARIAHDAELGEVERRVAVGVPAEQLAEAADAERAAFLVVGSRGLGPMRAAFLGSVSMQLVGLAPCPVLIVPPGAAAAFSAAADAAPVQTAAVARSAGADLTDHAARRTWHGRAR